MAEARRGPWGGLFIAAGILSLLAAAATWYCWPVQQEAFALLKVASTPPAVLAREQAPAAGFDIFKRTQIQLILSNAVLAGTLADKDIRQLSIVRAHDKDAVSWLRSRLTIDYPDDAEIMRITMRAEDGQQAAKIVNQVVDTYLREIVHHDKQMLMENEQKLRRAYEAHMADYQKELNALRTLEAIHKTSGSQEAQLKKRLAVEELDMLLAQRRDILGRIDQNDLEILMNAAGAQMPVEKRTADPPAQAVEKPEGASPSRLLDVKRQYLADKLAELNNAIRDATAEAARMENFSTQVATKQEELEAIRRIQHELGAQLDRAEVERLAPDRITPVDRAVITDGHADVDRRNAASAILTAAGLALFLFGLVLALPRR